MDVAVRMNWMVKKAVLQEVFITPMPLRENLAKKAAMLQRYLRNSLH